MKLPLLKDSNGKESISYTMMVSGFIVITLWLIVSMFESIAGISIREFDAGQAMAYLSPIMALYFGRKWQVGNTQTSTTETILEKTSAGETSTEETAADETTAENEPVVSEPEPVVEKVSKKSKKEKSA